MQKENQKLFFPALAGIRIIAAWMIFLHHISGELSNPFLNAFFKEFHVGIFFTLSGYLTYVLYFDRYKKGRFSFKDFIVKRLARLLPLYWILLLVAALWQWESLEAFFLSLFLLQSYFEEFRFSFVSQAWTIPIQLFFYASVPLFFYWIKKFKFWYISWPLIAFGIGLLLIVFFSPFDYYGLMADFEFMSIYTFFGRVFEFTIGTLIAALSYSSYSKTLLKAKPTLSGAILYFVLLFIITNFQSAENPYGITHPVGLAINHLALPFAVGLIILGLAREESLAKKFLSLPIMILLGNSAFAFYLIHVGYFSEFIYFHVSSNLIVRFLVLNGLAVLIYKFLELPIQRAILAARK